jgi:hypothetical protein
MKTAIYIEDGVVQLVITPENDFEKAALRSFEDKPMDAKVFAGSFYDCRGGWIRQTNDRSLILRMSTSSAQPIPEETP